MSRVDIPDKMFFRIGEAAELVGVEAHVLRYWEGEFKLRPQRSASGQRMYRRKDLEKFLRIRQLVHEEGFTIAGARKAMQRGSKTSRSAAIDPNRIEDAVTRIENARTRIKDLRARLVQPALVDLPPGR